MTAIRTIYVVVNDRKSGERMKGVRLARLAEKVRAGMPRGWATYRGGEYVKAGTRFLEPAPEGGPWPSATPVIKIRGNDHVRDWALALIATDARIASVTDYAREKVPA